MNEKQAEMVAMALGGRTWQSGGGIWLVLIDRKDGKLVVVSDEVISEYENQDDFDGCRPTQSIILH